MSNFLFSRYRDNNLLLVPKIIYLFFGFQYYNIYDFRGIIIVDGFDISPKNFGYYFGVIMFIIFFGFLMVGYLVDVYKLSKKKVLILLLTISLIAIELMFCFSSYLRGKFLLWIPFFIYNFANFPQVAILDKAMLDYLNSKNVSTNFLGNQKLYEIFGFLISVYFIENILLGKSKKGFEINFNGFIVFIFISISLNIFIIKLLLKDTNNISRNNHLSPLKLFKNKKFVQFIIIVLLKGIVHTGLNLYFGSFLNKCLKLKTAKLSPDKPYRSQKIFFFIKNRPFTLLYTLESISAAFLFSVSNLIIKSCGIYSLLFLSSFLNIIKVFILIIANNNPFNSLKILGFISILKGLSNSSFIVSGVNIADRLCNDEYRTTSQILFHGVYGSLTYIISGLIFSRNFSSGLTYEAFNIFFVQILGLKMMVMFAIILFYWVLERKLFDKSVEK